MIAFLNGQINLWGIAKFVFLVSTLIFLMHSEWTKVWFCLGMLILATLEQIRLEVRLSRFCQSEECETVFKKLKDMVS